ncbi:hypothetical protein NKG05_20665 [Oerskovia sp. M15]
MAGRRARRRRPAQRPSPEGDAAVGRGTRRADGDGARGLVGSRGVGLDGWHREPVHVVVPRAPSPPGIRGRSCTSPDVSDPRTCAPRVVCRCTVSNGQRSTPRPGSRRGARRPG